MQADEQDKAMAQADVERLQAALSDLQQEAVLLLSELQDRTERHAQEVCDCVTFEALVWCCRSLYVTFVLYSDPHLIAHAQAAELRGHKEALETNLAAADAQLVTHHIFPKNDIMGDPAVSVKPSVGIATGSPASNRTCMRLLHAGPADQPHCREWSNAGGIQETVRRGARGCGALVKAGVELC